MGIDLKEDNLEEFDRNELELYVIKMLALIGITNPSRAEIDRIVNKTIDKMNQKVEPEHFN